jgi:RES domain-containing protein
VALNRVRDLGLIDAIDTKAREVFVSDVWRVTRDGRDPLRGGASDSRWCNGSFSVLYTSLERSGAVAEVYAYLAEQPVFPSKLRYDAHRISVKANKMLRFADISSLAVLGVDITRYTSRDYVQTQAIADAAYFLEYDGLIAPSARWNCMNVMLFNEHISGHSISLECLQTEPVDWAQWRLSMRKQT